MLKNLLPYRAEECEKLPHFHGKQDMEQYANCCKFFHNDTTIASNFYYQLPPGCQMDEVMARIDKTFSEAQQLSIKEIFALEPVLMSLMRIPQKYAVFIICALFHYR